MDSIKEQRAVLGNRIKERRIQLGMSQEQLAIKIGYKSRSSINKIELGLQSPQTATVTKIAKALQATPAYLLGWDGTDLRSQVADMTTQMSSDQLKQLLDYAEFLLRKSGED